jgi:hypothetical protein
MRRQQEQEQTMIAMHAKLMEEEQLKVREREIVIGECIVELRTVIAASQIFELELQDVVDELREAEEERRQRAEAERERLAWITFWNAKASLDRKRGGAEHAAKGKQDASAGHPHPSSGPRAATRGYKPQLPLQHAATARALSKSKYVSPREVRARRHVIAGSRRLGEGASRWDEGMGPRAVGAVAAHGEGEGGGGGRGGVHSEGCGVGSDAQAGVGTRDVDGEYEAQLLVPGRGADDQPGTGRGADDQPGTGHSRSAGHYRSHNESHHDGSKSHHNHSSRHRGPNAGSVGRDGSRARGGGKTHRLWEGGAGAERRGGSHSRAQGKGAGSDRGGGRQGEEGTVQTGSSFRTEGGGRVGLPAILTPRERALACFRGSPPSPPFDG